MSDLKYSFTCGAARYTTHCEAFGYKPCTVCTDYELGLYEPHYPVPAIAYQVDMLCAWIINPHEDKWAGRVVWAMP